MEAIYELLASGKSLENRSMGAGGSGNPYWMPGSTPSEPEELEKLTTKMTRLSEEQARQVLEQASHRRDRACQQRWRA